MPLLVTRRQLLAGVAGAMSGVGIAASTTSAVRRAFTEEPELVSVTRHGVGAGDAGAPRLRVVQLTDLHLDAIGVHEELVASTVATQNPDLVVFTGDSVGEARALAVLGAFLDLLGGGSRKFAVVGDAERDGGVDLRELARVYERRSCELLINDVAEFQIGGRRVLVTGLDDLIAGTPDPARALVGTEPTPNHLLLAHCPAQRDAIRWQPVAPAATAGIPDGPVVDLAPFRPQWMLSGHTHGGQVAPFGLALFRPRGSGRYVSGWYRDPAPPLYVSRGIGTSVLDARRRAVPEVAVFEWVLA